MNNPNGIREKMPWIFGGEKWANMPSGWGDPYGCIDPAGRNHIRTNYAKGKMTKAELAEHWGVSPAIISKILRDGKA